MHFALLLPAFLSSLSVDVAAESNEKQYYVPAVYGNLLNENEFFMFALWRQRKTTFVELEVTQKSTHKSAY